MPNTSDIRLWNPDKKGTLILGNPRFGTHFLENLVASRVGKDRYNCHGEGFIVKNQNSSFDRSENNLINRFKSFESDSLYSTLIINQSWIKIVLMSRPDLLNQWHKIRLTHNDKIQWFISWWFFFRHQNSELYGNIKNSFNHHNTSIDSYSKEPRVTLKSTDIIGILSALADHTVNYSISVDEEIDYSSLKELQTDEVPWLENQYPSRNLRDMFENAEELEKILLTWNNIKIVGEFT